MDLDDFLPHTLNESLNEWCARLVNVLAPRIIENMWKLLEEARRTAKDAKILKNYIVSFQQLLLFTPKWSTAQVEEMRKEIIQKSGCGHLEELVTCAHIILTKALVCARPGNRQKQINVSIPKLDIFLHKVLIKSSGHAYRNAYLFEKEVSKLQLQKNMHDLEKLVQRAILDTIRENIPEEEIIRAFLDENHEYEEETIIEPVPQQKKTETDVSDQNSGLTSVVNKSAIEKENGDNNGGDNGVPYIKDISEGPVVTHVEFNETDAKPAPTTMGVNPQPPEIISVKYNEDDSQNQFKPKTVGQLAEEGNSAEFEKTASQKMTEDVSNLIDVFDLGDFNGGNGGGEREAAVENRDFLLGIEDI